MIAVILAAITEIAAVGLDDGVVFDTETAMAEVIRDEDPYQGVRVSMSASLATARPSFHVDVSVGDPITPAPRAVRLPRILGGGIAVRGYPLAMVHAEKIVTAIGRGTTSTRRVRGRKASPRPSRDRRRRAQYVHPRGSPSPRDATRTARPGAR